MKTITLDDASLDLLVDILPSYLEAALAMSATAIKKKRLDEAREHCEEAAKCSALLRHLQCAADEVTLDEPLPAGYVMREATA